MSITEHQNKCLSSKTSELTNKGFLTPEQSMRFISSIGRVLDNGYVHDPYRNCSSCKSNNDSALCSTPEEVNFSRAVDGKIDIKCKKTVKVPVGKIRDNGAYTAYSGCYPKGIKAGCAKYLECECSTDGCPIKDMNDTDDVDNFPILRRCTYLGCVRPERVNGWLYAKFKSVNNNSAQAAKKQAEIIGKILSSPDEEHGLDTLCPHHWRHWNSTDGQQRRRNPFRTLQCEISRPTSRPTCQSAKKPEYLGRSALDLPKGWFNRLGISGVGIIVVAPETEANNEKLQIFYLQLSSTKKELRDYYEFPYFYMGSLSKKIQHEQNSSTFPDGVLLQLLFRSDRESEGSGQPEVMKTFGDARDKSLSHWEECNKILYCSCGEMAAWLFMWVLLAGKLPKEELEKRSKELLGRVMKLAKEELNLTGDEQGKLRGSLSTLITFVEGTSDDALMAALKAIGLLDDGQQHTHKAEAMLAWLQSATTDFSRNTAFICTAFSEKEDSNQLNHLYEAYKKNNSLTELANEYLKLVKGKEESAFNHIEGHSRFPILPYAVWWRMSAPEFLQGHFALPLGSGDRFSGRVNYSDNDSRFFLAGVDEQLWMEHKPGTVAYHKNAFAKIEQKLHTIIPIATRLVAPISDATISYTFFQADVQKERALSDLKANFYAHQQTNLLRSLQSMKNVWSHETLENVIEVMARENEAYLCYSTKYIPLPILDKFRNKKTTKEVIKRFQQLWNTFEDFNCDADNELELEGIDTISCVGTEQLSFIYPYIFFESVLWELFRNASKYAYRENENAIKKATISVIFTDEKMEIIVENKKGNRSSSSSSYRLGEKMIEDIIEFSTGNRCNYQMHDDDNNYKSVVTINFQEVEKQMERLSIPK